MLSKASLRYEYSTQTGHESWQLLTKIAVENKYGYTSDMNLANLPKQMQDVFECLDEKLLAWKVLDFKSKFCRHFLWQ